MLRLKSRPLYIPTMARSSRGRPTNAPPGFIHPCRPIVAQRPPSGPGWVHELKHDGYRLQVHVRDGRVRLYTMNGADWSKRYPRIVEEAARIKGHAIIDAEVVCLDSKKRAERPPYKKMTSFKLRPGNFRVNIAPDNSGSRTVSNTWFP